MMMLVVVVVVMMMMMAEKRGEVVQTKKNNISRVSRHRPGTECGAQQIHRLIHALTVPSSPRSSC
jgi:hypothetical protein